MSTISPSDVLPVRSRVAWSAIFAGAFVALAEYFVLAMLGVAIGLSVHDRTSDQAFSVGAGVWALLSLLGSLFVGGLVASKCTVGESQSESVLYGVLVWGVFLTAMALAATGTLGLGAGVVSAVANPAANAASRMSDEDLEKAGFNREQINSMKEQFGKLRARVDNLPDAARETARDPRTKAAAWWTFAGLLSSLLASSLGAWIGSGPQLMTTILRVRGAAVARQEVVHQ